MAMAMPGQSRHCHFHAIQRRHFNSTARQVACGDDAEALPSEMVGRTPAVVGQVRGELPAGLSEVVADKVLGGLMAAARALETSGPARV
jgi:serine/threonine-protein kinase HipA